MVDILGFASTVVAVAIWILIILTEIWKAMNPWLAIHSTYHGWIIPAVTISTATSIGWFLYG